MPDDGDDRPKSSRERKKRFRERDDLNDEDDRPRSKRFRATDDEDDPPRKKQRVKANGNTPVVMLLALVGGVVALLVIGGGCVWWWFATHSGGVKNSGSSGGHEFEVTTVVRLENGGHWKNKKPFAVAWSVEPRAAEGTEGYFVVVRYAGQMWEERIAGVGKFDGHAGTAEFDSKGSGPVEVWVEKRQNPAVAGKVVSNVRVVP